MNQFIENLTASGVMSPEEIASFHQSLDSAPPNGEQLAKKLIEAGKLTKFQARSIAAGKGASLQLDRYIIKDKIGAGGMGQVYLAEHQRMEREVAIKVLPASMMKNSESIDRFHREVKAAARLNHTNIVTAYDANEDKGVHFLVMERISGRDLSSLVKKKGPLSVSQTLKVIQQAAAGLSYAHEQGVIHRDIKPSNLLLDEAGVVKILDMGLARIDSPGEADRSDGLTNTGMVMGTIDYMAPEQAMDTRTADARSDIYSLGCTLFYLLTAKPVYGGDTVMKKLLAHRDEPIPQLKVSSKKIPAAVQHVFEKMVAKRPEDRFQTMQDVLQALETCRKSKTSKGSTAADPDLANALDHLSAESNFASGTEFEESQSNKSAFDPTVIGSATLPPRTQTRQASRTSRASAKSQLPKWIYAAGGAVVLLILMTVMFIPGDSESPNPSDLTPELSKVSAIPAGTTMVEAEQKTELSPGVAEGANLVLPEADTKQSEPTISVLNHALKFDGEDDLVLIKTLDHPVTEPITYEATVWFDPPAGETSQGQILVAPHGSLLLGPQERPMMLLWHALDSRAIVSLADPAPMQAKRKYQLAACWDGSTYRFFVDGQLVDRAPLAEFPSDKFQGWFAIGGHVSQPKSGGSLCFPGLIDEVRISKISRYENDYQTVYRFEPDENTLALYHFDQSSGNVLKDSSKNGHDGTIRGAEFVRVDPDLNVITGDLEATDPWATEREVAEWVIAQGGTLYLDTIDGKRLRTVQQVSELPADPFQVSHVDFEDVEFSLREFPEQIPRLVGLDKLSLAGGQTSKRELDALSTLEHLTELNLYNSSVTSADLSGHAFGQSLNRLQISTHQINDDWRFLSEYTRLRTLTIYGTLLPHVEQIGNYPQLRLLWCGDFKSVDPKFVSNMQARNPKLRILSWRGSDVQSHGSDPWLKTFEEMIAAGFQLTGGIRSGSKIWNSDTDPLWKPDRPLIQIYGLKFPEGARFDDRHSNWLNSLNFSSENIIFEGMINADRCAQEVANWECANVICSDSDLTDTGLVSLANIHMLSYVSLEKTRVTQAGIEEFKRKRPLVRVRSDFGYYPAVHPRQK